MADLHVEQQTLHVSGLVCFETVNADVIQVKKLLANNTIQFVDFAHLQQGDSTCIALMLEMLRQGGENLRFNHIPQSLLRLIKLSELETIFQLSPSL